MKLTQITLATFALLAGIGQAQANQSMKCIQMVNARAIFEADYDWTARGPGNVKLYGNLYPDSRLTCTAETNGAYLCGSSESKLSLLVKPSGIVDILDNGARIQSLSCYPFNR